MFLFHLETPKRPEDLVAEEVAAAAEEAPLDAAVAVFADPKVEACPSQPVVMDDLPSWVASPSHLVVEAVIDIEAFVVLPLAWQALEAW